MMMVFLFLFRMQKTHCFSHTIFHGFFQLLHRTPTISSNPEREAGDKRLPRKSYLIGKCVLLHVHNFCLMGIKMCNGQMERASRWTLVKVWIIIIISIQKSVGNAFLNQPNICHQNFWTSMNLAKVLRITITVNNVVLSL